MRCRILAFAFLTTWPAMGGLEWSSYLGAAQQEQGNAIVYDATLDRIYVAGRTTSPLFPATQLPYAGAQDAYVSAFSGDGSTLLWSTCLGGGSNDEIRAVALFPNGDILVGGTTSSVNLPGATNSLTPGGAVNLGRDALLARLTPAGSLVWTRYLGGSGNDEVNGLAITPAGDILAAGGTTSPDFPLVAGLPRQAFFARLSGNGVLLAADTLGVPSAGTVASVNPATAVALDPSGGLAYVAGYCNGTNALIPTPATLFQPLPAGGIDGYVLRWNLTTAQFDVSTWFGGSAGDLIRAVAVDAMGRVVASGTTNSSDLPMPAAAYDSSLSGQDAFVARFDPTLASLTYASFIGGPGTEDGYALAIAPSGDILLGGETSGGFPTTAGATQTLPLGQVEAFVVHLHPSGLTSDLVYATVLSTPGNESVRALASTPSGEVVAGGHVSGTSSAFGTPGAYGSTYSASQDAWVCRHDLLPTGVSRYGTPSPVCPMAPVMGIDRMPQQSTTIRITVRGLSAGAQGVLALSLIQQNPPGLIPGLPGLLAWIGQPVVALVPFTADPDGYAEVTLPLPANTAGIPFFAQALASSLCGPTGFVATGGLEVVIQP